ncbi:hypothetical protein CDL12_04248 [Handroanthus impetiginosus]|uniref:Uncharacterized protein n=1 Tax=Handroanthus impetiginosus TaxID=429701 RepID=A0A2G9HZU0_9LAMI|nr:hypothetical protein CDL12_04248 [Handroanthus impetiginosus]
MLLLAAFADFYDTLSFVSWHITNVKRDIELAFVIALFYLMPFVVDMGLASKSFLEGITIHMKERIKQVRAKISDSEM